MFRLTSWGRSSLDPHSCDRPSLRRVFRTFCAARRRWPSGRFVVRLSHYSWVPMAEWYFDGIVGVSLHWATFGPRA